MENKWSLTDVLSEDKYYLANSKALSSVLSAAIKADSEAPDNQNVATVIRAKAI